MLLKLIKSIILLGGKMRIPYKTRLLIAISVLTVVFIAGCVDTSVNPLPNNVDYSSQISIANLVSGAGAANLTLNSQSLGTADLGSEYPGILPFLTVPSGNKVLSVSFATAPVQTYKFAAISLYKQRIYLVGTAAKSEAFSVLQRYARQTIDSPTDAYLYPVDTASVTLFNGSPDAKINSVTIGGNKTTFTTPLVMGKGVAYTKLAAGSYDFAFNITFKVALTDTTSMDSTMNTTPFNYTVVSQGRYSVALYDSAANLQHAVFIDD